MTRQLNNLVSVGFSLIRFSILKIFKQSRFQFHPIQRFSPNTQVSFMGTGTIILKRAVRAHTLVRLKAIHKGCIEIGANTSLNYGCMVTAMDYIKIGSGVEFGPNVLIYDHDHDFRVSGGLKANKFRKSPVEIGDNCWIGANVVILRGTKIGDHSVVGAGAVLTGNYPPNSLILQKRETTTHSLIAESKR